MDYGKILLNFRARHNMSRQDLADLFGIHKNMVERYENGTNSPSPMKKLRYEYLMNKYEETQEE